MTLAAPLGMLLIVLLATFLPAFRAAPLEWGGYFCSLPIFRSTEERGRQVAQPDSTQLGFSWSSWRLRNICYCRGTKPPGQAGGQRGFVLLSPARL